MAYAILVAGGTAGHINAALSLGEYLALNKYKIQYISGTRYLDKKLFSKEKTLYLDSKPLRTKNPFILLKNILKNLSVFIGLIFNFLKNRPDFVIGAGGYVCGPSLLAAWVLRIPIYIIEQNACAGLTNKILANISRIVFTHFDNTRGLESYLKKIIVSGNPTRSKIQPTSIKKSVDKINILVFGGSLGARQINNAVYELLTLSIDLNLSIKHQVGKGNLIDNINIGPIDYLQVEYIDDMQKEYEWCDIVVSRAGASTISELRVVSRPSILIPFPAATDNHQYFNAIELKNEKKFYVDIIDQSLQGKELAEKIISAVKNIIQHEYFESSRDGTKNASKIIIEEIEKDVWNK